MAPVPLLFVAYTPRSSAYIQYFTFPQINQRFVRNLQIFTDFPTQERHTSKQHFHICSEVSLKTFSSAPIRKENFFNIHINQYTHYLLDLQGMWPRPSNSSRTCVCLFISGSAMIMHISFDPMSTNGTAICNS